MNASDPSRDYYAALETSPTSGDEEIKKQYRKLALLYHPDRNPGKEAEYNPRFQIIQEAYQCLSNPEQRVKYDLKRKRGPAVNSPAPRPRPDPAPRGNPYQARSAYPPPPRRTGPQRTHTEAPPTSNAGPSTERYNGTQWAPQPPPRREQTSAGKDAEARKNVFAAANATAWQNMNPTSRPHMFAQPAPQGPAQGHKYRVPPAFQAAQQRPVPPPPPPGQPASRHRATSSQEQARSAFEETQRQQANITRARSTRTTNRPGLNPSSLEDEGPVNGPAIYRTKSGFGVSNATSPADPPRSSATTQRSSNEPPRPTRQKSGDDVPFVEGEPKIKTPYPPVFEQPRNSYFDNVELNDLKRTTSMQDARKLSAESGYQTERRKSDDLSNDDRLPPRPRFSHVDSTGPHKASPLRDPASDPSDGSGESSETDGVFMQANGHKASTGSVGSGMTDGIRKDSAQTDDKLDPIQAMRPNLRSSDGSNARESKVRFDPTTRDNQPKARNSNPNLRSTSQESSNVSPTDKRRPSHDSSGLPRSSSFPNVRRVSSQATYSEDEVSDGDIPPVQPSHQPTDSSAGDFKSDQWEQDLKETNWASQWAHPENLWRPSAKSRFDSKSSRGSTRSTTRGYSQDRPDSPFPTTLDEAEQGPDPFAAASPPLNRSDAIHDPDAMDVDTEPLDNVRRPSIIVDDTDEPQQAPRAVYAEPSNPEWRDRMHNGVSRTSQDRRSSLPHIYASNSIETPAVPVTAQTRPTSQARSPLGFAGFDNVAPFKQPGLSNGDTRQAAPFDNLKADMSTNLPFTSQASPSHPFVPTRTFSSKELPQIPKAPDVTSMSIDDCRLMFDYVTAYHKWYNKMLGKLQSLGHEMARYTAPAPTTPTSPPDVKSAKLGTSPPTDNHGINPHWINARGETLGLTGFDTYFRGLKDGARLRAHLDAGSELYLEAMERFQNIRRAAFAMQQRAEEQQLQAPRAAPPVFANHGRPTMPRQV